jgi:hypothetical protein
VPLHSKVSKNGGELSSSQKEKSSFGHGSRNLDTIETFIRLDQEFSQLHSKADVLMAKIPLKLELEMPAALISITEPMK